MRRLFRGQGPFPAYRSRACAGYYTLLTGTAFANTRQWPGTLVLLLRGVAKGEPTARLEREFGRSRIQLHTLRQHIQARLHATAPTEMMAGTTFEVDERCQNSGEQKPPTSGSHRPAPSAHQYTEGSWHLCPRSLTDHQCDLAGDGCAALLGV